MEDLIKLVTDVGFPVVIAIFFIVRNDRRQEKILDLLLEVAKSGGKCESCSGQGKRKRETEDD